MKRLLVSLLIILLLVSCSVPDPLTELVKKSQGFTGPAAPDDLIQAITAKKINLLGEHHYLNEIHDFYDQMLAGIHDQGVRLIAREAPVDLSLFWNDYVLGKTDFLPDDEAKQVINHVSLERAVREFNDSLRASGRAEEQFQIFHYDVSYLRDGAYDWQVKYLRQQGLSQAYDSDPIFNLNQLNNQVETGLEPAVAEQFRWLTERVAQLVKTHGHSRNVPLEPLISIGKELAEFRETYSFDNLVYRIDQLAEADKVMIICGAAHASLMETASSSDSISPKNLAQRLNEHYPNQVNSWTFLVSQADNRTKRILFDDTDLLAVLNTYHSDQWSWIDMDQLKRGDYTMTLLEVGYRNNSRLNLAQWYDGIIVIPQASSYDLVETTEP